MKFGYVKKYKATLNLILSVFINILLFALLVFVELVIDNLDTGDISDTWIIITFIVNFLVVLLPLTWRAIIVFKRQKKFNKNTPEYYFEYKDDALYTIGDMVDMSRLLRIKYEKIPEFELYGGFIKYSSQIHDLGDTSMKNENATYVSSARKSKIGNIIFHFEDKKVVFNRVNNISQTISQLQSIIEKYKK